MWNEINVPLNSLGVNTFYVASDISAQWDIIYVLPEKACLQSQQSCRVPARNQLCVKFAQPERFRRIGRQASEFGDILSLSEKRPHKSAVRGKEKSVGTDQIESCLHDLRKPAESSRTLSALLHKFGDVFP